jgi:hypothetical protein
MARSAVLAVLLLIYIANGALFVLIPQEYPGAAAAIAVGGWAVGGVIGRLLTARFPPGSGTGSA